MVNGTSWLLYSVIVVSALIIIGAILLLLRVAATRWPNPRAGGRRGSRSGARRSRRRRKMRVSASTRTPSARWRSPGPRPGSHGGAGPDLAWRHHVLLTAMGPALTAVAAATYLLADGMRHWRLVALALAGPIIIAMPAILVLHKRMLTEAVDEAA